MLAMVSAFVRLRFAVELPDPMVAVRDGMSTVVSSCNACKHIKDPSDTSLGCYC